MFLSFQNGITSVGRSQDEARSSVANTVEDEEEYGALVELNSDGGKRSTGRKTYPSATLSITNPTRDNLG